MSVRPTSTPAGGPHTPETVHRWTALLLRAQAGDRPAFAHLVAEAEKPLYGFIYRKLHDRHVTEDLLADTFLKAWRTLSTYKPDRCQANTWLFMIARRLLIDHLRKKSRRREMHLGKDEQSSAANLVDYRGDATVDRADHEYAASLVRRALEKLPDRYAEALDLMYLQGMDRHEIAVVLGCSVNAASSLLTRARDRLQEELKALQQ